MILSEHLRKLAQQTACKAFWCSVCWATFVRWSDKIVQRVFLHFVRQLVICSYYNNCTVTELTRAVCRFSPSMIVHPEVCLCYVSLLLGQCRQMLGYQDMCPHDQSLPLHIQLGKDVLVQQFRITNWNFRKWYRNVYIWKDETSKQDQSVQSQYTHAVRNESAERQQSNEPSITCHERALVSISALRFFLLTLSAEWQEWHLACTNYLQQQVEEEN